MDLQHWATSCLWATSYLYTYIFEATHICDVTIFLLKLLAISMHVYICMLVCMYVHASVLEIILQPNLLIVWMIFSFDWTKCPIKITYDWVGCCYMNKLHECLIIVNFIQAICLSIFLAYFKHWWIVYLYTGSLVGYSYNKSLLGTCMQYSAASYQRVWKWNDNKHTRHCW